VHIGSLFTAIIYQPFFNLLIFFYWCLDKLTAGNPDMGVAVILLTIVIRILLLPMTLSGDKSESERRQISAKVKEIESVYSHDPVLVRQKTKQVLRGSRSVLIGEIISLVVQVIIALMLYRIFATGLEGKDFHLIYSFMPEIKTPINLVFLGKFDLAHASLGLNLIQSICIFLLETLAILTSPYPHSRDEVVRLQLVLPVVSFLVFMFLPAGKKVFVITTLIFSIILTIIKFIRRIYLERIEKEQAEHIPDEALATDRILVETRM